MAKEKISRETYDTMRSSLLKKKNAKINLDDYEVNDSKKTHSASDNEKNKKKRIMALKKNTIRLTESDLKRVISESVKRVLKEMDESNEINKLLSQTSDYLIKFDASDEARKCAQALENWTEYRESYILDCLNFACRHAHKCLNSDIDEDPNAYLQVAFEARKMWRKYMTM